MGATVARSLEEILKSMSDVLFPAHAGEYPVSIESEGYDGDRPLHVSVWRGDLEAVEVLLRAGADPNTLGEMDQTPLHVAVTTENVEIAAALLKHGARGDVRSEFGDTPRELAAALGAPMLQLFNQHDA